MATNRSSVRRAGRNRISRLLVTTSTLLGISTLAGLPTGAVDAPPPAGATTSASTLYVGNPTNHTITSYGIPTTGGNVKPGVTVSLAGNPSPAQLAFDASGDLWTANTDAGTITEYMPTQLAAGGTQPAAVTITCTEPVGLVFTGAGDLWVANWFGSTLSEYTPTQLKASSHPTAAVKISSNGKTPASLTGPANLAVDASGDLWVANSSNNTIVEFKATQLTSSGDPNPAVTITSNGTVLEYPLGLGFDTAGDLWVASSTANTIVEFKATQLTSSGDPTPEVTISSKATSLGRPIGIAFDSAGDLWASNQFVKSVVEYTPNQLAAGGALTPAETIQGPTSGLSAPTSVAIKQPPTVTSLSPATGPERGGTTVTVHGTGFTSASKVSFGSTAATTVKVVSPFTLTAVAPKGLKTVTVTVGTFAGTSAPSAGSVYTYVGTGYDLVGSDGGVFVFPVGMPHGFYGSLPSIHVVPNKPVVGMVATVTDSGYFLVAQDGGVFAFTAPFLGSLPGIHVTPAAPIVGIVAVDTDKGYFLVGQDGGVFTFGPQGTVTFLGSLPGRGIHVNNIIGMAATPSGNGYWLVSATGTVYTFGAAQGNLGTAKGTPSPVSAIAGTATGGGYWITTQNGAVYAFGNAQYQGSLPAIKVTPAHPVIGIVPTANTTAYWLLGSDGGIFTFAPPGLTLFYGSLPGVGVHVTNIVAAVPN